MFVVPLKGDKIETKEGVEFTVLSYTNYREKGPAVYVEHTPGVPSDAVYFFDINKINGKVVDYVPGSKVFRAGGEIRRKIQLPQNDDTVSYRSPTGLTTMKVDGMKLHKRGELAKGLLISGKNPESDDRVFIRLDQIVDINRNIGSSDFSRDRFLSYYDDYRGQR
jgi:hypothetical protein